MIHRSVIHNSVITMKHLFCQDLTTIIKFLYRSILRGVIIANKSKVSGLSYTLYWDAVLEQDRKRTIDFGLSGKKFSFTPDDGEDENENVRDLAEVVIKKLGERRKEGRKEGQTNLDKRSY